MMFDAYLCRWGLARDGDPVLTSGSRLLPVRRSGTPAMLKLALTEEERLGGLLMQWWDGQGAAPVLALDEGAVLLERALGRRSLSGMARNQCDDEACRAICAVAARLHAPRRASPPPLVPLARWLGDLGPAAAAHGGILVRCAQAARRLLAEPREVGVLHGDLHHGNILDFAESGWLAIDPKGLLGERAFDFAVLFANPDLADPTRRVAIDTDRFARCLMVVAEAAGLERQHLLCWVLAWAGLSASWLLNDGLSPAISLQVAELAAAALNR